MGVRQTTCEDVICSFHHVAHPVIACIALNFAMSTECQLRFAGGQMLSTKHTETSCQSGKQGRQMLPAVMVCFEQGLDERFLWVNTFKSGFETIRSPKISPKTPKNTLLVILTLDLLLAANTRAGKEHINVGTKNNAALLQVTVRQNPDHFCISASSVSSLTRVCFSTPAFKVHRIEPRPFHKSKRINFKQKPQKYRGGGVAGDVQVSNYFTAQARRESFLTYCFRDATSSCR